MDEIKNFYLNWKKKKTKKNLNILFQEIWKIYHPKLQVYLRQFMQRNSDYSDSASEILIKVFESIEKYNPDYSLSTWIYTLARNYQIDKIRKKEIHMVNIDDYDLFHSETPESKTIEDSEKSQIRDAVSSLSTIDRELIYLHFYEELKYEDISEITGIPTGTIKYRMSENRKQIRKKLEGCVVL